MSLRRNQLKRMNLEQIMTQLHAETDPANIELINSFLTEKNQIMIEKKTALLDQLQSVRNKLKKAVHGMNGRVKDRIEKTETIVMSRDSRPTNATTTELLDLFGYFQKQGKVINRNNQDIKELGGLTFGYNQSLKDKLGDSQQIALHYELDSQYAQLHKQCEEQEIIRDALLKERNDKRAHYSRMGGQIQQCRIQYEAVEAKIRDRQRQLIQLTTYLESRQKQDKNALEELPKEAINYETELLQAQNRLNQCQKLLEDRQVRKIESFSPLK